MCLVGLGVSGGVERPCLHTGARHRGHDPCLGVSGGVERPCLHTGARHRGHDPCLGVRVGWRGHACTPGPDTGAMTRVWG